LHLSKPSMKGEDDLEGCVGFVSYMTEIHFKRRKLPQGRGPRMDFEAAVESARGRQYNLLNDTYCENGGLSCGGNCGDSLRVPWVGQ
jgi:hypothetical protein